MSEPLIELRQADLGYGRQAVLRRLNLRFRREAITAILGDNGSGKTTLLHTLAGFIPPLSGEVLNPSRPRLGFVPQEQALDENYLLSAFEVAAMGAFGRIAPGRFFPKSERAFVRDCLRATAAEGFADEPFSRLSGGQKQRVLIARALATRPELLLLDEPTSGVDARTTREIMERLRDIQRRERLTVIMVTHDFSLVRQFASEVVWLREGEAEQGPVEEVLARDKLAERLGLN